MAWARQLRALGSLGGAVGAALGSAAASLCCVGPLALTLLGVQGAILASIVKPYRYWLLAGSAMLIGAAAWSAWRGAGSACEVRTSRVRRAIVWGTVAVWLATLMVNLAVDWQLL